MAKYSNLTSYLKSLSSGQWTATFSEIETILGFDLPASAGRYPAWWSNQAGAGHSQSNSWQSIGWRTRDVSTTERRVTFVREVLGRDERQVGADVLRGTRVGISIVEAKAGLSAYYSVPLENVEILIKG